MVGVLRQIDPVVAPLQAELVLQGQQLPLAQLALDQRRGQHGPAQTIQHRIPHQLETRQTDVLAPDGQQTLDRELVDIREGDLGVAAQILLQHPFQTGQRVAWRYHHQGANGVQHIDAQAAALLLLGDEAEGSIHEPLLHQSRQLGGRRQHQGDAGTGELAAQGPQHVAPDRFGDGVVPRHPQRHLGAGGMVLTLELQAVGRLQQPLAVIQHLLPDLRQSTSIRSAFKKFDAKLHFQGCNRRAHGAATLAKSSGGIGYRTTVCCFYKELYLI